MQEQIERDFTYDDSNICLDSVACFYDVTWNGDFTVYDLRIDHLPMDVGNRSRDQLVAFFGEAVVERNEREAREWLNENGRSVSTFYRWAAE